MIYPRAPKSRIRQFALPGAAIAGSVIFVGAVLGMNLFTTLPALDKETFCLVDTQLKHHTLIVVDATDPFTKDQAARLRAAVAEEREALPVFGKFTVVFVTPNAPFEPVTIVSLCNPGKHANPVYENPEQRQKVWLKKFSDPIDAAIERLLEVPTAQRSPILETVTALSWRHDFDNRIAQRKLRIVSDLLQLGGDYSHYQVADLKERFTKSSLATKVDADLANVVVRIDYLRRIQALQFQTEAHRLFWRDWLINRGASSVDFGVIERNPSLSTKAK